MTPVLIGYMRVSKADGSQALDLQRDSLFAVGVDPTRLYEDNASGKRDDRPGRVRVQVGDQAGLGAHPRRVAPLLEPRATQRLRARLLEAELRVLVDVAPDLPQLRQQGLDVASRVGPGHAPR